MKTPKTKLLAHHRLIQMLQYVSTTGVFIWKVYRNQLVREGAVAGSINYRGYIDITIDGIKHQAHRLAWFYVHRYWPINLDHRDRNKRNNRIKNLRPASVSQNTMHSGLYVSNTSGIRGIRWDNRLQKWQARIGYRHQMLRLGWFSTKTDAARARCIAERQLFGNFTQ